jgi:hypothetical protein
MDERYSIDVSDEIVEIYGDLTIEEAFDLLSFFERKGYKSVVLGSENSTLRMMRRDQAEVIHDQFVLNLKEQITDFKDLWEKEKKSHESTAQKTKEVEALLKQLMSDEYKKYKALHEENQRLLKIQAAQYMSGDPQVQEILKNTGFLETLSPDLGESIGIPIQGDLNGKNE